MMSAYEVGRGMIRQVAELTGEDDAEPEADPVTDEPVSDAPSETEAEEYDIIAAAEDEPPTLPRRHMRFTFREAEA